MHYKKLETERLYLENIAYEDRDFILRQFSDEAINRYLFDAEPISGLNEADDIIGFYLQPEPRGQHRWILVNKKDNVKIGTCGFHALNEKDGSVEIGYDLQEEFWGKGYMLEALDEILQFAKDQRGIRKVCACIYPENEKSIKLVKNLGFVLTGKRNEYYRGKTYPHEVYTLVMEQLIRGKQ